MSTCPCLIQSGIRKNQRCGAKLKGMNEVCGRHYFTCNLIPKIPKARKQSRTKTPPPTPRYYTPPLLIEPLEQTKRSPPPIPQKPHYQRRSPPAIRPKPHYQRRSPPPVKPKPAPKRKSLYNVVRASFAQEGLV